MKLKIVGAAVALMALSRLACAQPWVLPINPTDSYLAAGERLAVIGTRSGTALDAGTLGQPGGAAAYADNRFGDAVNITAPAFGASSAAADNSTAINAAIATGKTVLVPTGIFHTTHMLSLQPGQRMVCMGRTVSQITVGPDFSPTDPFVVQLAGADPGSEIENCGITFAQPSSPPGGRAGFHTLAQGCTVTATGTGCKYPWAIGSTVGSVRPKLRGLRIAGAWDGISMAGSGQQASSGFAIDDVEVGALDIGLYVENATDFCHIRGYHHWPFGMAGSTSQQPGTMWPAVWNDGSTYAAQLGRCDGMSILDFVTFQGRVAVLATNQLGLSISNLHLDGNHANLEMAGGNVRLSNVYSTKGGTDGAGATVADSPILVSGGNLTASGVQMTSDTPSPMVKVTGGTAILDGGFLEQANAGGQAVATTGGFTLVRNMLMMPHAVAYTLPYVFENGGLLDLRGNKWTPLTTGSGTAVQIGVDTAQQVVADNDLGGWGYLPPPGALLGTYGPNKTPAVAFTPAITIITPGTFAPTYTVQKGHYWYTAQGVEFDAQMTFSVNSYTGASGQVLVTGLPFGIAATSAVTEYGLVSVPLAGSIVYESGYSALGAVLNSPPNSLTLVEVGPNVGYKTAPPSIFYPGSGNISISLHGVIPAN